MSTKAISEMDQGNDLPIGQGGPLVKTTLKHENVLCLLSCFHVSSETYGSSNTMLRAVIGPRTGFQSVRHRIRDDASVWKHVPPNDLGVCRGIIKVWGFYLSRFPTINPLGVSKIPVWNSRVGQTQARSLCWGPS